MSIKFSLFQGSRNISDWWLAYWISQEKQKNHATSNATLASSHVNFDDDLKFYLTVYGSIAGANTVSMIIDHLSFMSVTLCCIRNALHYSF